MQGGGKGKKEVVLNKYRGHRVEQGVVGYDEPLSRDRGGGWGNLPLKKTKEKRKVLKKTVFKSTKGGVGWEGGKKGSHNPERPRKKSRGGEKEKRTRRVNVRP